MKGNAFLAAFLLLAPSAAAQELRVYFLDVGQGDGTFVVGPTGKTLLMDAGNNGQGNSAVIPFLQSLGVSQLDFMVASHYHADHVGGLDEAALGGFFPGVAYDRGELNPPTTATYNAYKAAIAPVHQTLAPGQILDLGGGATAQCMTVAGYVHGYGQVNIAGSSSYENSASIGLLVRYGDFELWIGGDLTGGTSGTTDVESVAAPFVGDIEVYQVNHHGSASSSNQNWVNATRPEVSVFSAGDNNSYGHPHVEPINRLNAPSRATLLYCTNAGTGNRGFVNGEGTIRLATDGTIYTIVPAVGPSRRLLCDEKAGIVPAAGDLFVTEYFTRPTAVPSALGQYFEIQAAAPLDRTLRGIRVSADDGQSFTFQSAVLLGSGERLAFAAHGDRATNGGLSAGSVWPYNSFSLTPGTDAILLREGSASVDDFRYTAVFPDPVGKSVEKKNVPAAASASNFAASTAPFGSGQWGTPGLPNSVDNSDYPARIELASTPTVGGTLAFSFCDLSAPGFLYYVGLTGGSQLGLGMGYVWPTPVGSPPFFLPVYRFPGSAGLLAPPGIGQASLAIPTNPGLVGLSGQAGLLVIDQAGGYAVEDISSYISWTIQ